MNKSPIDIQIPARIKYSTWIMRIFALYLVFNSLYSLFSIFSNIRLVALVNNYKFTLPVLFLLAAMFAVAIFLWFAADSLLKRKPKAWLSGVCVLLVILGYQGFNMIRTLTVNSNAVSFDAFFYISELVFIGLPLAALILLLIVKKDYFAAVDNSKK